jgi:hypothetical protein
MIGYFQIADLAVQLSGSPQELIKMQAVEREFDEACEALREASGGAEPELHIDEGLPGEHGTFTKVRLRAYNDGHLLTTDCGVTENNPWGYYPYDEIEVYDLEDEEVIRTIDTDAPGSEGDGRSPEPPKGDAPSPAAAKDSPQERPPIAVICPTCGADAHEPCVDADTGEGLDDPHNLRSLWARGRSGDADAFLQVIGPWLEVDDEEVLTDRLRDIGQEIAAFEREEWARIADELDELHPDARSILQDYRSAISHS